MNHFLSFILLITEENKALYIMAYVVLPIVRSCAEVGEAAISFEEVKMRFNFENC